MKAAAIASPALQLIEKNIVAMRGKNEIQLYSPLINDTFFVLSGVFNPLLTNVSPFFAKYLNVRWKEECFLEIGCGSGLLSCFLAQKGALVTATDISSMAGECTRRNIAKLHLSKKVFFLKSDLFARLGDKKFDTIVFNPPLVPVAPPKECVATKAKKRLANTIFDVNARCISRFFAQVKKHLNYNGRILLVYTNLAERHRISRIPIIAELCRKNNFLKKIIARKTFHNEVYTIYLINLREVRNGG